MFGKLIGAIFSRTANKAWGGGLGAIITSASVAPIYKAFRDGILVGATPNIREFGAAVGAAASAGVIGWITTYFVPKNKPENT